MLLPSLFKWHSSVSVVPAKLWLLFRVEMDAFLTSNPFPRSPSTISSSRHLSPQLACICTWVNFVEPCIYLTIIAMKKRFITFYWIEFIYSFELTFVSLLFIFKFRSNQFINCMYVLFYCILKYIQCKMFFKSTIAVSTKLCLTCSWMQYKYFTVSGFPEKASELFEWPLVQWQGRRNVTHVVIRRMICVGNRKPVKLALL